MSTETNYDINYEDDRFKTVESEKTAALKEHEQLYDGMISESGKFFEDQINATKEWADTQTKLQQEQTDFAIEQIEQQKEQVHKDYLKEQSGAYVDWKKQSDQHGVRAEQIADMGMQNTGYSESAQVSMYNTYQNRVATARESVNRIIQDFNNGITEARLQNNAALAEIRLTTLKQQLELNLQGFQHNNQLLLGKAEQKLQLEQMFHNRWQDVLGQINTENALAEQIRQYNESLAEEQRQFNFYNKLGEFAVASGGGGGVDYTNYNPKPKTEDDTMGADTARSLAALSLSGYSPEYINKMVQEGKINVGQSTTTGNPIYSQGGLQTNTTPVTNSNNVAAVNNWVNTMNTILRR